MTIDVDVREDDSNIDDFEILESLYFSHDDESGPLRRLRELYQAAVETSKYRVAQFIGDVVSSIRRQAEMLAYSLPSDVTEVDDGLQLINEINSTIDGGLVRVKAEAVLKRRYDVLDWLRERGEQFATGTLMILVDKDDPWGVNLLLGEYSARCTDRVVNRAAALGRLEIVKVLYQHWCRLTPDVLVNAAGSGNVQLLDWLKQRRLKVGQETVAAAIERALAHDCAMAVEWLYSHFNDLTS